MPIQQNRGFQEQHLRPGVRARSQSSAARSRFKSLAGIFRGHHDLLRNAGSLIATTVMTSVLGFAFWIYAARFFSSDAVGYASAAVSTMMLLGTVGEFGIGTMLIGELPRAANRGGLITASMITSFIASFVLGLGFGFVSMAFGSHFVEINGTITRVVVFSFGVGITGAALVFDEATIGLMRGGLQLNRNVTLSIVKMAALPAAATVLHDRAGTGIILAWILGTAISVIPPAIVVKRGGHRLLYRPDWTAFWHLRKVTVAHNSLNLAITTPTKLIPVLVAVIVSPSDTGAYYIATMISGFLTMVPTSLSTMLFAVAAATPEAIGEKLRFVLRMSLYIGIPAALAMALCSHFILSIFGSNYAALGTVPLLLLIAQYFPGLPNSMYIAVARATGQVNKAAVFFLAFLGLRAIALVIGGELGGLYGLSYGMLAILILQAMISTPKVLRVANESKKIHGSITLATANRTHVHSTEDRDELRRRQEAGLAALIALADSVSISPYLALTTPQRWPERLDEWPQSGRGVPRGNELGRYRPGGERQ